MQEDTLLEGIRKHRHEYEAKILSSVEDNVYQHERHSTNFSLAIGATSSADIEMEGFSHLIRESDKFIVLDSNIACVVFSFVDGEQGLKAASNLLMDFEAKLFSKKIYMSILNTEDYPDTAKQVNKLFSILEFSISNKMNNIPLDEIAFETH